jgi:hypothetical protein
MTNIKIGITLGSGGVSKPNGNPSSFSLTKVNTSSLQFDFTIGSTNQDGHYIYLSLTETGGYFLAKTVTGTTNTGTITGLDEGTLYYGYAVAFKGSKVSDASNTDSEATVLLAPENLVLTVLDDDRIKSDWSHGASTETGFKLERGLDGSTFGTIIDIAADTLTYTNSGLDPNTKYYYRLRAYKGSVYSDYTSIQNATTLFPELVTSLVNGTTYPYETFTKSGVNNITSAINSAGNGSFYDNVMNLTVNTGDKFRLKFDFVLNSGASPNVLMMADGNAVSTTSSNVVNPTTGSHNVLLTIIAPGAGVGRELVVYNTGNSNFAMTNISLRKEL